jgi:hypothetical protein
MQLMQTMQRQDRRQTPRLAASPNNTALLALELDQLPWEAFSCPAQFLDISRGGTLLTTARSALKGDKAAVALLNPTASVWLLAQVVDSRPGNDGQCLARLKFDFDCPVEVIAEVTARPRSWIALYYRGARVAGIY